MVNKSVKLDNVYFNYEENKPILSGINLEAKTGKITAIMGGSGCGKTTVLRLISGLIKANHGTVQVFGENINNLSSKQLSEFRTHMGMLFQFGALFTDMSVYENVAFTLKEHTNLPESIIKKIVAMKLNAVGLFGTQDMMPQELSGGMARRVALARATALDPYLMLYDEPFTGLDPISLNVAAMLIKKLGEAFNQTVILVTHDIETALKIAHYIYFMANGKIIAEGTPEEIKNTDNPLVCQFIKGEIKGPFQYKYESKMNYNEFIGI